jgi:hypothetical protein
MKKNYMLVVILSMSTFSLIGQVKNATEKISKKDCSCGFQSLLQAGFLEGASGPSWNLQTINGVYYKSWYAGVGVGIDYYNMRTVPLFIDLRKELFQKARTPFIYADGGIQFEWFRKKEKFTWGSGDFRRGRYYDVGAGYKFGFGKRDAILVSAGYSLKSLRQERDVILQCIQPPCDASKEYYNYKFTRLTFKVGWQFR